MQQQTQIKQINYEGSLFAKKYNYLLINEVINSVSANNHRGTNKQKGRAEVSGGNSKPWKQKGRGLARAGSIRSPLFRGGGKTFPSIGEPKPIKKINKKAYKSAILSMLGYKYHHNQLTCISDIELLTPKTKDFINLMKVMKPTIKRSLLIVKEYNENLFMATNNLVNRSTNGFIIITSDEHKSVFISLLNSCSQIYICESAIHDLEQRYLNH